MEDRVHKTLEALDACAGRSCGLCPYTSPRTAACERMLKNDAAALIGDLWGIISQPMQNAPQASQLETRASILEAARRCVCGEREGEYGTPEDSFSTIARLWSAYCEDRDFSADDVACMMALLKIARIIHNPGHMDSWVDGCGYLACGAEIAARRAHEIETRGGQNL